MRTLIPDPLPTEVQALLESRREHGADRHDEVWEGVLHVSPPPSARHELIVTQLVTLLVPLATTRGLVALGAAGIGVPEDYRVPDLALLQPPIQPQWQPTAALAVEVLSARDSAWDKLEFYAAHSVRELVVIDSDARTVDWRALDEGGYTPVPTSAVIELRGADLEAQIDWSLGGA